MSHSRARYRPEGECRTPELAGRTSAALPSSHVALPSLLSSGRRVPLSRDRRSHSRVSVPGRR
eukprot:15468369-Alexandrium_andersonii.AAC.1